MSSKKILVVDDEPDMVAWLTAFLEDSGYETISAENGREGFDKAVSEKPDLITLDVSMDEESGVGSYKRLCRDERTAAIPVVMITGVSPEIKAFIGTRKSVPPPAGFFEKPVDRAQLLAKIRELLA